MNSTILLPERAQWAPGAPIVIEVRGDRAPGTVHVRRLGDPVAALDYSGDEFMTLSALDEGGYGVEFERDGAVVARTAIDVRADAAARMRYGFVAAYPPGGDGSGIAETVRRLHLTAVQCYDWAYRHADLLGGGDDYRDALDQPVSLETVRRIVAAVRGVGAVALGYAAVYAVGPVEWERWRHAALLDATGQPHALGDFLFIVDPAAPDWLEHFAADLVAAREAVGFDGFHLDQYGYPKRALRADGELVDVAESFTTAIDAIREVLPTARLVFNQVNDFPTWRTAAAAQDAIYIEPWAPQTTLGALAATVDRARALAGGRPVVLAAYQHVYDTAEVAEADRALRLTMAVLHSHGATQLLAGETDRILVDPYYVRNHVADGSTADVLQRWYDFLVEHDEVLMDPRLAEVTTAVAGEYNDDCDVRYPGHEVGGDATAGTVYRRITGAGGRLVVHLVNLLDQDETGWDTPKAPITAVDGGRLRVRVTGDRAPRVRVADPDGSGRMHDLAVSVNGTHADVALPALQAWQLIVIDLDGEEPR
jgi:dextranase